MVMQVMDRIRGARHRRCGTVHRINAGRSPPGDSRNADAASQGRELAMRTATRGTALAFSLGMHALLLGGFLLLARDVTTNTERVYRVALAELAPTPSQPAPAQASRTVRTASAAPGRAATATQRSGTGCPKATSQTGREKNQPPKA
ncbi:hypothetical protein Defa_14610 [Desulfovibrio sp. TH_2024_36128]|uniref:Energy transducer TonB n=2 Tax=Desulfovibrio falkowii TaxID=3136602 RepID=A0ABQ0E876_9BACT